jgi:hypothetical protein
MSSLWQDRFWLWMAHRMPRVLVRWCVVRCVAHATTGKYGNQIVSELSAMDAMDRWEKSNV